MRNFLKVLATPFIFVFGVILSIIISVCFIVISPVMGWLAAKSFWYDDLGTKYWRTTKDDVLDSESTVLKDDKL